MPSPDPIVTFLYLLMRDHVPTGVIAEVVGKARSLADSEDALKFSAPELEALAERYSGQLRAACVEATGEQPPAPPAPVPADEEPLVRIPVGERTALQAVAMVFGANPNRWVKLRQVHEAAGGEERFAFTSLRIAMQRYVREGGAEAAGSTAARVYRALGERGALGSDYGAPPGSIEGPPGSSEPDHDDADEGDRPVDSAGDTGGGNHDGGAIREHRGSGDDGRESGSAAAAAKSSDLPDTQNSSDGSPDQHAGSAETLPPRSQSDGHADESPDGDGDAAGGAISPKDYPGASSPTKRRRRKMAEPPHRPLPKPPEMERIQTGSHGGRQHRGAPAKTVDVAEVSAAIEPWVREQQTFRRRHVCEAFPHYGDETIRSALLALQNAGIVTVDASAGGGALYSLPRAPKAPEPSATVEGRVLSALSMTGASLSGVAIATGMSREAAAPVLSKLMREGDVRTETRRGERVFVAA